jgi:NAD dependent epimerase/dehydratase family enzyme
MAMVMSPARGGPFHALLRHVRLGFGRFGDGRQYMSWIHERDFVRAVRWLIDNDGMDNDVEGVVNLAAPEPLPCDEFLRELRDAWGVPVSIP